MRNPLLALFLVACSATPADPLDGPGGDKQDGFGRTYSNEVRIDGARTATIKLEKAFQCEVTQFALILGWHNQDRQTFDFPTFRTTFAMVAPLVKGQVLDMTSFAHRFVFDGVGYGSDGGGGCQAEVAEIFNNTRVAGVALTFEGCKMRALGGGQGVTISGDVFCSGQGFTPIDLGTPAPDAGVEPVDAAPPEDMPDAAPVEDPCHDACGAGQVCVKGSCVLQANQTQSEFCNSPTASCDPGEDGDCAAGHACVEGKCRRLTCQAQSEFCNSPTAPCEGDDDGDCDTGHACVAGKCRRLTCQAQSEFCNTPTALCDGDDDGDCADGHACVAGKCRRLSCQTQSEFCNTATAPCDEGEDGDCADGHTCIAGVCKRLTCQP